MRFAIIALLFFTKLSFAAKTDEVAHSKVWLRLLHYKMDWLGRSRSLADGPEFFFSLAGNKDPKAELLATIEAFSKDIKVGKLKQHPQCAFPERYSFLKSELHFEIKNVSCPELERFLNIFNAKSVTLVYSSAFASNPVSIFGHTFLRFNTNAENKSDLLDWGLNYSAKVPADENRVLYAFRGIFGGYRGELSIEPYYAKVNEYNNSESRNLWEYDLNLTAEQTRHMLMHAWELDNATWFDYYFLDENCSYLLLSLIEAARPDWDLTNFAIYVAPGETIKRVAQIPGAVTHIKLRPSLRNKLYQHLDSLSDSQRKTFL